MVILPLLVYGFFGLLSLLGLTVGVPAIVSILFGWFG
jgi:hypothetical protein